jgi:opacity protein-like surface antigen
MKSILLAALLAVIPASSYADVQVQVRDHDAHEMYRHERYERFAGSHWSSDRGRWNQLARGSSGNGRQEFTVGNMNRFRAIRVEAVRGEPAISKIMVEFATGGSQVIGINETLPAGAGEVIDLTGESRRIKRVIVYPEARSRGTYAVYGV